MSTIYQLAEDVKQYVEIESVSSGGGANNMKIKAQKGKTVQKRMKIKSHRGGGNNMKQMIIKDQKGNHITKRMNIKSQEGRAHCKSIVRIDVNIEKSTNVQEKVRSLSSRPIKKLTVLIISYNNISHMSDRGLEDHWRIMIVGSASQINGRDRLWRSEGELNDSLVPILQLV
jgi:hypothetical protein